MVEGSTGLNIKDYPFAFSVTALFFPSLLSSTTTDGLLGVLLVGGMLGSLLTIINPINRILTYYSKHHHKDNIHADLFGPVVPAPHNLIRNIVSKNFESALTSPQITFEQNKTVGMIYFIIILISTIIQSVINENFLNLFSSEYQIWGIRIGVSIGLMAVGLVMLNHVYGINFKFKSLVLSGHKTGMRLPYITSPSQLDRVCCVTVANLAIDFANLSNAGIKWIQYDLTRHDKRSEEILHTFYKLNQKVEKSLGPGVTTSFSDFSDTFNRELMNNLCHNDYKWHNSDIEELYRMYFKIKEISATYNVKFSEALSWFDNQIFLDIAELYGSEPRLRAAIESRDWKLAELAKYGIVEYMKLILDKKIFLKLLRINGKSHHKIST